MCNSIQHITGAKNSGKLFIRKVVNSFSSTAANIKKLGNQFAKPFSFS
jgi:hypothetical protein